MTNVLPFPRIMQVSNNAPVNAIGSDVLEQQRMVAAAMRSWMDGDPLTQREQRIVDVVLDTNYFGQLGRLALGG